MTGRRIFVNKTLINCFVDQRNRRIQKLAALGFVRSGQSRPKFLNLSAQFAPVAAVDLVSLFVLPDAFYG